MIATMSHNAPMLSRRSNSQDTNMAGVPLPRIPRRNSSTPSRSSSASATPEGHPSPLIHVQQATPPDSMEFTQDFEAAVSGGIPFPRTPPVESPQLTIRARRMKRQSIEDFHATSPTPESKGKRRPEIPDEFLGVSPFPSTSVSFDSITAISDIPSTAPIPITKSFSALHYCPPTLYTKSGRPIKSSLKSRTPKERGSLTVITGLPVTKSEPVTPKAVHFDAQLEHVKLFLSAQRPRAISNSGSPAADDTSGNESTDVPVPEEKELVMHLLNMPEFVNKNTDLILQEMKLTGDKNITGSIRVRNLAFQKWVAVRFTLDSWQTTSEVAARYASAEGDIDIFDFTIKLSETLTRIEEKTLVLALHYRVNGIDIWDNNQGRNYVANFSQIPKPSQKAAAKAKLRRMPSSEDDGVSSDDLRSRLEKVVRSRKVGERPSYIRRPLAVDSPAHSRSRSPSPTIIDGMPVSSPVPRYEFDLKRPWDGAVRDRVATYPISSPSPSVAPFSVSKRQASFPPSSKAALGSPRDNELVPAIVSRASSADDAVTQLQRHPGFFDQLFKTAEKASDGLPLSVEPYVAGTDDALVVGLGLKAIGRATGGKKFHVEDGASDDSTPSIMSPSWSSSPANSSDSEELPPPVPVESPGTHYRHFVNRFCFFTGNGEMQFLTPESERPSSPATSGTLTVTSSTTDNPLSELTILRSSSPTSVRSESSDTTISSGSLQSITP